MNIISLASIRKNFVFRRIRDIIYFFFSNFFYNSYLYKKYCSELKKLDSKTQVFLALRDDFGTFLLILLHIRCWQKNRGDTCLLILSKNSKKIHQLAKAISPETKLISSNKTLINIIMFLFGKYHVQYKTILSVLSHLRIIRPNIISLYNLSPIEPYANYICELDSVKLKPQISLEFLEMYKKMRKAWNYHHEAFVDFIKLHNESYSDERENGQNKNETKALKKLLNLEGPYVTINLKTNILGRRGIKYPERYNCLIDFLIEKGFSVVIQGRDEQPIFKSRKGLIDYARSPYVSIDNDLTLYSNTEFAICAKTGPEIFCDVCDVPVLGLNYSELVSFGPSIKRRYYPKHVLDAKTNRILSWKEFLNHPSIFDIGDLTYPNVELLDLEEEEMIKALIEFLPLVSQPKETWLQYTELQMEFKKHLNPMHMDLYHVKSMPCDAYLQKSYSSRTL